MQAAHARWDPYWTAANAEASPHMCHLQHHEDTCISACYISCKCYMCAVGMHIAHLVLSCMHRCMNAGSGAEEETACEGLRHTVLEARTIVHGAAAPSCVCIYMNACQDICI